MENLGFGEITISMDDVLKSEELSQEVITGIYKVSVEQAALRLSKNTQSKAVELTLSILSNKKGEKINQTRNVSIWFIGADGNPSEFGVNKLGAILFLLGLPTKITPSMFEAGKVLKRKFSEASNKYEDVTEDGYRVKCIEGKQFNALLGITYGEYNGYLKRQLDLVCVFNDSYKTASEIKTGKEAESWEGRLNYALEKERSSYNKFKHLDTSVPYPNSTSNETGYGNDAYNSYANDYMQNDPYSPPTSDYQAQGNASVNVEQDDGIPF